MGFCMSRVNYVDVCYVLGKLCVRISGFSLRKEAVSFRNLVDSIEYFYDSEKKIPVSVADTAFVIPL